MAMPNKTRDNFGRMRTYPRGLRHVCCITGPHLAGQLPERRQGSVTAGSIAFNHSSGELPLPGGRGCRQESDTLAQVEISKSSLAARVIFPKTLADTSIAVSALQTTR